MTIVTMKDWRAVGGCKDAIGWCTARGIDWRSFVRDGIDVDILRETGDNLSKLDALEEAALKRIKAEGGQGGK